MTKTDHFLFGLVFFVSLSFAGIAQTGNGWEFTESKLAQISGEIQGFAVSPDKTRVAYAVKTGRKSKVFVNGVAQAEFDSITSLQFSPDGRRTAFLATQGKESFIVVDGTVHQSAVSQGSPLKVAFTPDSERIYYQTSLGWVLENKLYYYVRPPVFSSNGKRFAFCASDTVNIDGQERKVKDVVVSCQIAFSPDSKHVAFLTVRGEGVFLDVDGKETPAAGGINALAFPTHTRKGFTLIDVPDMSQTIIAFSPDSSRLAYWGYVEKKKGVMVIDGTAGAAHTGIGNPVFSADSKHIAYTAWDCGRFACPGGKIVLNGVEQEVPKGIQAQGVLLVLSRDGRRVGYRSFDQVGYIAGLDGVLSKSFQNMTEPVFSPSGRHFGYFAGAGTFPKPYIKWRLYMDGVPYGEMNDYSGHLVFISDDEFHYTQLWKVDDKNYEIRKVVARTRTSN